MASEIVWFFLTFSLPGHEQVVEVPDDLPGVSVGLLTYGRRHGGLGLGQESGEPLAVDVHAVLDRLVLGQRQGEAVAYHLRGDKAKKMRG